jgi:hypothetical protein
MTSDNAPPAGQHQAPSTLNGSSNGTPRTKICVYCGASGGKNPAHVEAARQLARVMAANDIDLGESPNAQPAPRLAGEVIPTTPRRNAPSH